jgi:hypothetical protein
VLRSEKRVGLKPISLLTPQHPLLLKGPLPRPLSDAERGILYGLFLANFAPHLLRWSTLPTGFVPVSHGWLAWALTACVAGVFLSGLRDVASAFQNRNLA